MSDDRSNEYFSDGLTEELLNLLARIPELKVIARTSSFAYKGKEAKISEIARELQVANVLEGSVRKSGDRIRITAQLIRTSDSTHLWSQSYDRTVQDIFAVQDEIAGEVVDSLKVKLLGADHKPVQAGGTNDARAYEAYLRGRYEWNKGESQELAARGAGGASTRRWRSTPPSHRRMPHDRRCCKPSRGTPTSRMPRVSHRPARRRNAPSSSPRTRPMPMWR